MKICCECGEEADEESEESIVDVPFGEELVHFCCKKCYDSCKV